MDNAEITKRLKQLAVILKKTEDQYTKVNSLESLRASLKKAVKDSDKQDNFGSKEDAPKATCKMCEEPLAKCNCDKVAKYAKGEMDGEDMEMSGKPMAKNALPPSGKPAAPAAPKAPSASLTGATLTGSAGAHPVGQAAGSIKPPAPKVQTMVERVASSMKPKLPKIPGKAAV